MRRDELHYELPPERIAQHPVEPRDAARLLVLDRTTGHMEHRVFRDLPQYLSAGDALVLNDTRVIPARFFARRATGGRVEVLFLHETADGWRVLLRPAARLRTGQTLACEGDTTRLELVGAAERGQWLVRPQPPLAPLDLLTRIGRTPLPPYIRRSEPEPGDADRYQTVYAREPGAVAAPTAGMHFTPQLLAALDRAGVRRVAVTLHVGAGTFTPIEADDLADHRMHAEWFAVSGAAMDALRETRSTGGRIVAVGTTAARVLESLPEGSLHEGGRAASASGWTDLFIYTPYRFRHVDRLVTNFHLPGSTLLAMVMAFASPDLIRGAYALAIAERYRFYSYGDAMLIL